MNNLLKDYNQGEQTFLNALDAKLEYKWQHGVLVAAALTLLAGSLYADAPDNPLKLLSLNIAPVASVDLSNAIKDVQVTPVVEVKTPTKNLFKLEWSVPTLAEPEPVVLRAEQVDNETASTVSEQDVDLLQKEVEALRQENEVMATSLAQTQGQLSARISPPPAIPTAMPPTPPPYVPAEPAPEPVVPAPTATTTLAATVPTVTDSSPVETEVSEGQAFMTTDLTDYLKAQLVTGLERESLLNLSVESKGYRLYQGTFANAVVSKEAFLSPRSTVLSVAANPETLSALNSTLISHGSSQLGQARAVAGGVVWEKGDTQITLTKQTDTLSLTRKAKPVSTFGIKRGTNQ